MAYKCPMCRHDRIIDTFWFKDYSTNLDTYAVYCRSCYYLSSLVGSLNPFTGFKKHNGTSDKKMIDYTEAELIEKDLPRGILDAILQDKK